jgi:hypothetical protein
MSESYWDNETRCPSCGCKGAQTTLIPRHHREWKEGASTIVHHMPESKDRECNNCSHQWTDYPEGTL